MKLLPLCLLLGACAAAVPPVPPEPLPVPPPVTPAPVVAKPPAVSVAVVKKFDAAKAKEIGVVLGPDITEEQIAAIRSADRRARTALTALGLQGHQVTGPVLGEARQAVRALEAALEPAP